MFFFMENHGKNQRKHDDFTWISPSNGVHLGHNARIVVGDPLLVWGEGWELRRMRI